MEHGQTGQVMGPAPQLAVEGPGIARGAVPTLVLRTEARIAREMLQIQRFAMCSNALVRSSRNCFIGRHLHSRANKDCENEFDLRPASSEA